jgi:hypothetical protein
MYIHFTPPTQYGWVCPKCGRVNAPMMMTCQCFAYEQAKVKPNTVDLTPKVEWAKGTTTTTPTPEGQGDE